MTGTDSAGRVLLLVPTTSYRIGDFLEAARKLGIDVAVGSGDQDVLERLSRGQALGLDLADLEAGVGRIFEYARRHPLAAILAVDQETTVLAARAAQALGLPHNPPDAVAAAGDKYRFRAALANSGLNVPRFTRHSTDEEARRAARRTAYPCVLKPLALSAGRGVIRADDEVSFVAAFHRIKDILASPDAAQPGDAGDYILVEDYIPGAEVSLEGLLEDGRLRTLALFDKPDPLEGPYFEETIYVTPSRLPAETQRAVAAATETALGSLGLRDGPIHAEIRINDKGAWVIEIAARSIGGLCARSLSFGAGVALEELILGHALGLSVGAAEREEDAAGVMMIPIPGAGVLDGVDGITEARAVPGIEDVTITIPLGQDVVPLPEGFRYLGFIFAKGSAPEAVEAALRQAHARLSFAITPAAD
ncbi:MAG: ATP-grasp domain-containing protein [Rhodospirillales bacterium]|jgi:biotin carboxylase|nr:ATP-grasp domain-containing protein [Rhodospirillales bacterium]MDP6773509.1 ATP-grasp domain-containing protein [Rhodospirillales bacterium]